jgi:hypothetical protein
MDVRALPATAFGATFATMNGQLASDGAGTPAGVAFCWGYTNSGTGSTSDWPNVVYMGDSWTNGMAFSNELTGLLPETEYVYICYATNSTGAVWSDLAVINTFSIGGIIQASGGNATNEVDGYRIHLFTNSATAGSFIVTGSGPIEVLIVAGGGGGGYDVGGGGGAGGLVYIDGYPVHASNYTVTVGGGGPGGTASGSATGQNGADSAFGPLVAIGGGGGGNHSGGSGANGGAGGGGAGYSTPGDPGCGIAGQGNDGGAKLSGDVTRTGSGGGGAGGVGDAGVLNRSGSTTGGVGLAYSISGTNVTYATGGRGAGDDWTGPAAGAANTGNGGDGAGSPNTGKAGGSGIVIVRYPLPQGVMGALIRMR